MSERYIVGRAAPELAHFSDVQLRNFVWDALVFSTRFDEKPVLKQQARIIADSFTVGKRINLLPSPDFERAEYESLLAKKVQEVFEAEEFNLDKRISVLQIVRTTLAVMEELPCCFQ